jgi:tetratricopeptide (TPR) repeat protein
MSRGGQVHKIIESLSRGEKRQFKLNVSKYEKSGKQISAHLFDVLDGMKTWDEAAFQKKIKNTNIAKNTSVHINTLLSQLLEILRINETAHNVVYQINRLVEESIILVSKQEPDLALTRIRKAKRLAVEAELYEKMIEILKQERSIQFNQLAKLPYDEYRREYYKEIKETYRKLENQSDYLNLVEELFHVFYTKGHPNTTDDDLSFDHVMKDPLMKDIGNALTSDAQSSFYFIHIVYYQANREMEKAREAASQQVKVFERNPKFTRAHIQTYVSILNNLALFQAQLDSFETFSQTLKKWRNIPEDYNINDRLLSQRIFELSYGVEFDYYIAKNELEKTPPVIREVEKRINTFEKGGATFLSFLNLALHVAICHYRLGRHDKAHEWAKKVLEFEDSRAVVYNILFAMILDIALHYLQNDHKYLKYRVPVVRKYFIKHHQLTPINQLFFQALKKIPRLKDQAEADAFQAEFKKSLDGFPNSITKEFYKQYLSVEDLIRQCIQAEAATSWK